MKHLKHILRLFPVLVMAFMIICVVPSYANTYLENTDDLTVTENSSYTIISGVTEGDLTLTKRSGEAVKAHVILVKPNAKAKFKAITPGYYTSGSTKASRAAAAENWSDSSWSTKSLTKMAAEYESASDTASGSVIAGINGDFGISTDNGVVPRGSFILEGNKEMAHSSAASDEFFFGYRTDGSLNIVQRTTSQKDSFTEVLCGSAFILRNGKPFGVDNETEARQRTGVAIKPNGDTLLITVESGITVKQLAELMQSSGCINGINMDGGGSTTMITKRSGETKTTRRTPEIADSYSDKDPETGERKVSSALLLVADNNAVANTAWADSTTTITTSQTEYEMGKPLVYTARSSAIRPWVGLYKVTDTPGVDSAIIWSYINGVNDGGTYCWNNGAANDLFTEGYDGGRGDFEAGEYKLIAFAGSDYDHPLAESGVITITTPEVDPDAPYSLQMDKEVYDVGEDIRFKATAPVAQTWVGIFLESDTIPGDISFYHYKLNVFDQGAWKGLNTSSMYVTPQERNTPTGMHYLGDTLRAGEYKVILFQEWSGDNVYTFKDTKHIRIIDPSAEYTVTYMDGTKPISGITPGTYMYTDVKDGDLPVTGTPTKAGHVFKGWYDNENCTGTPVTGIPKGSMGNKTYYAKFEPIVYTVSFDTDGGTEIASQQITYGENATEPDEPEKEELVFLGWTTTKGGSEAFDFSQPITGDTTVYASWGEKGYIITFDTQGGSPVNKQTVKSGGKAIQPSNPKRDGYTFRGWYTTAEGTERFNFSGTVITADTTIYALWRAVNYSITYDLNGGTAGESADNPTSYNAETPTFTLKAPEKDGHVFTGWMDEEGNIVEEILQGSFGDIVLTAQWKKESSLTTDKEEYVDGQAVRITAYCENPGSWIGLYKDGDVPGTSDLAYYWSWVTDSEGNPVISGEQINLLDPYYKHEDNSKPLAYGTYHVILFGDSGYNELLRKTITIKENTENPLKGSIEIAGYSRDDKKYNGEASSEKNRTLFEYFYGDDISVKAEVSGLGAEDAWVGVIADQSDMTTAGRTVADHWYWAADYSGQTVSLNYMINSEINEENSLLPFGLNYWLVLVSGSGKILDAEPFNFRTYNMDWNNVEWGDSAKQNIKIEPEWTSRLANGENQKPSLKITRINGLFGYTKDSSGKLTAITEEVLQQGRDYTVSYPSESKAPGSYTIKVTFPSAQPTGDDGQPSNNYYKYLSTTPENYGLQNGVKYFLTDKAGQHVITYELNGGVNNAGNPELYTKGEAIELLPPSKTGCIFEGWYTTSDFRDGTLIEKIPADLDEDITVYARWADEHTAAYKITYVLNGGTNDSKNPDGYTGNTDLVLRPAKKPNSTFDGWFFDAAFTKPADVIPKGMTGDLTVYAKFTKIDSSENDSTVYAITTSVTGGSISDNVRVKKGSSHTVTYEPSEGYVLKTITVDGKAVDIKAYPTSYTFENVTADHTINVVFSKPSGTVPAKAVKGKTYTVSGKKYKVTKVATKKTAGTVTFTKAKNVKSVLVPATVKIKGGTYKVTRVGPKAFTAKKIRYVTIGKNVRKIDKYAFKSSKATTVTLKTRVLAKSRVKGSLKSSKIKTVKVKVSTGKKTNKSYLKKYKKYFTKTNAGRKVTIK